MLTGRENVIMMAKLRHAENPKQTADNLLKKFCMTEAADTIITTAFIPVAIMLLIVYVFGGAIQSNRDIRSFCVRFSFLGRSYFMVDDCRNSCTGYFSPYMGSGYSRYFR